VNKNPVKYDLSYCLRQTANNRNILEKAN